MFNFGICASFCVLFFFFVKNLDIVDHQGVVIKYCVCHSKMAIKTLSELKEAYGDACLAKLKVLKWHAIFVKDLRTVPTEFGKTIKVKWQERLERCIEH